MRALSIRQPWAWLIIHGGKDIENRNWSTRYRGKILIHASKLMTSVQYDWAFDYVYFKLGSEAAHKLPKPDALERGGIIGSVEIADCVASSDSQWFMGRFGFKLRDARPLPFKPYKGRLGFFNVDGVIREEIK